MFVCFFLSLSDVLQLQPLRRCQEHGAPLCGRTGAARDTQRCMMSPRQRPKKGNPKAPRTEQKPLGVRRFSHIFLGKADTQSLDTQRCFCTPKGRSAESPAKPLCVSWRARAALKGARSHFKRPSFKLARDRLTCSSCNL